MNYRYFYILFTNVAKRAAAFCVQHGTEKSGKA